MTRVLVLAAAMWLAQPLVAHADTVSPRDYRQRLTDARALVVQARVLSGSARDGAVTRARLVLLATTAIVAALYPIRIVARLPIAATLRDEVVG